MTLRRLTAPALLLPALPVVLLVVLVLAVLGPARAEAGRAWVWPVIGPHSVSRAFDPGPTPYAPGHRGADLPAAPGAGVLAAGDGRVSYAGLLAGRGVVVVEHGALRTTYEPVTPVVRVGQSVTAGQRIGTLDAGHEGCPVPACLHWGLRRGDDYLDPVRLVDSGPVRLLPRTAASTPGAGAVLSPPGAALLSPRTDLERSAGGTQFDASVLPAVDSGASASPPPGRWPGPASAGTALLVTAAALVTTAAGRSRRSPAQPRAAPSTARAPSADP